MPSLLNDETLEALLDRLHTRSEGQDQELSEYLTAMVAAGKALTLCEGEPKGFFADKLVALERDKAEFCYQLCRALGASRVVEVGTSHGVSTLYLAAAVRDNAHADGGAGVVIGTEFEPQKAAIARDNFAAAGLSDLIDLREGDLRETLRSVSGPVDFMLVDTWPEVTRRALELVSPHLRRGAVIICDNTEHYRDLYRDYFEFIADPANCLRTMTLPFSGGLEMTVRV
jgi:predicted O-methyltransferase YrrM